MKIKTLTYKFIKYEVFRKKNFFLEYPFF